VASAEQQAWFELALPGRLEPGRAMGGVREEFTFDAHVDALIRCFETVAGRRSGFLGRP
jgi:hypothetical protein